MSEQPAAPDLRAPADDTEALRLLRDGELDLEGRLLDASNVTLVGTIRTDTLAAEAVYKPVAGERPLWDFPDGTLAGREISAFLVSEATGWRVVPPTVLREGPFGPGMVQLWVDGDDDVDLAAFVRRDEPALRRMAVYDAVVNNADRKGGHIIPMPDGHVYGVDHGICFSVDPKLRTLLWRWAGKPLTAEAVEVLERLADELPRRPGGAAARAPDPQGGARHPAARGRAAAHRPAPRAQRRVARPALAALLIVVLRIDTAARCRARLRGAPPVPRRGGLRPPTPPDPLRGVDRVLSRGSLRPPARQHLVVP